VSGRKVLAAAFSRVMREIAAFKRLEGHVWAAFTDLGRVDRIPLNFGMWIAAVKVSVSKRLTICVIYDN
jgi:hypothetical protein